MFIVFRADASTALGGGHVMRCLTLAGTLERLGWRCGFAVNAEAPGIAPALTEKDLLVLSSAEKDAAALRHRWPSGADWLVVDHYERDAGWEAECRSWAKAILVLDDLADRRHDCDVLLDQTFGRGADDYAGLVPPGCRVLAGSDYALLRPAFAAARQSSLKRRSAGRLQRVLISLGATDPENHSIDALRGIAASGLDVAVDVILGAAAPHAAAVRAEIAAMPQEGEVHVNARDIPQLMSRADIAVGAAGTSTWERCCLGLPSLMVVIAQNQRLIAETVSSSGAARWIAGPRARLADQIAEALCGLAANPNDLRNLSARSAEICDGRGCDRASLALAVPGLAKDQRPVALRLAGAGDEETILCWQRHPTTRRFSRNPKVPSVDEHHAWFSERLADPECLLAIITLDGEAAGMLRLDPLHSTGDSLQPPHCEVSILVDPERRGLGIALEALTFLRRWQGKAIIVAEVLEGNQASANLFRAADYQPGSDGLLYSYPMPSAKTLGY
ncbi:MAG: UDP-2,4-diacetamido-2,4,6-trideoxy-beta-L-altropyranose hydrolase [Kiloniellaceae bacterium]